MSLDKRNITGKIASIVSITDSQQFNRNTNSSDAAVIGKSRDPFNFMVSLISFIRGEDEIKTAFTEIFSSFAQYGESEVRELLKDVFKEQLENGTTNAQGTVNNLDVPAEFMNNGDLTADLTDPCQRQVVLGSSGSTNAFANLRNSVENPNQNYPVANGTNFNFNNSTGEFKLTTNFVGDHLNFINNELLGGDIKLIDTKKIFADMMDELFGSSSQSLRKNDIIDNDEMKVYINRMLSNNDEDDDYFNFREGERQSVLENAENKKLGQLLVDTGCGIDVVSVEIETLCATVNNLQSDQRSITNGVNAVTENAVRNVDGDRKSIIRGFFRKLMDKIKTSLIFNLLSNPKIKFALAFIYLIKNGTNLPKLSFKDLFRSFVDVIKCIVKKIAALFNKFLFNFLKKIIGELTEGALRLVLKEKKDLFLGQLRGLIAGDINVL